MKGFVECLVGDRRFAARHNLRVPLLLRVRTRSEASEWKSISELKNLSENGLLFASDLRLAVGARVEVLTKITAGINQSYSTQWIWTGHVVRVEARDSTRGTQNVAVKFDCYEVLRPDNPEARALRPSSQPRSASVNDH
jgi:PilZ domain